MSGQERTPLKALDKGQPCSVSFPMLEALCVSGWALPESLYVSGCWSMGVYKLTHILSA